MMKLPALTDVEDNLKNCLLLKADDLYFTLDEDQGSRLRNEFIGIAIEGLADENVSPEDFSRIDLDRFAIYRRVKFLYDIVAGRCLSDGNPNTPDSEYARQDGLEFVEYFLSTLPSVAMGGCDQTHEAHGAVKDVYAHSYAWLNLVDAISGAFEGETTCELTISDLALLSGLDRRSVHNKCGPAKEIRTTVGRYAKKERKAVDSAFVTVHPFDAIAWLCSRSGFSIKPIDLAWVTMRLTVHTGQPNTHNSAGRTRGLLVAALVNGTRLNDLLDRLGITIEQCRDWYDLGAEIPEIHRSKLAAILQLPLH